jgi:hypothetical protein
MAKFAYKKWKAVALVEYIFPAIIICIGLLALLPPLLNNSRSSVEVVLGSKVVNGSISVQQWGTVNPSLSASKTPAVSPAITSAPLSSVSSLDSSNPLNQIPQNTYQAVETLGANGYTDVLADSISAYVQQLVSKNILTPNQASTLVDLASTGHQMACVEKAASQLAAMSQNSPTQFLNATIMYNGQSQTAAQLRDLIGIQGIDYTTYDASTGSANIASPADLAQYFAKGNIAGPLAAQFITLYSQSIQNGSLNDPNVNTIVGNLAYQIALLADASSNTIQQYTDNTPLPGVTLTDFSAHAASAASTTHANAVVICVAGKGADSGTQCNP